MNLPSGLIFYLDFKYNNGQFGGSNYSGSSLFGGDGSDLGSTNVAKTVFMEMVDSDIHYLTNKNGCKWKRILLPRQFVFDDLNYDSRFAPSWNR